MAKPVQIAFKFTELAELMVKKQNIHEGHWSIMVRFGLGAANTTLPTGELRPTALVPVVEIGIQRNDEPTPLTVNAAIVNPRGKNTPPKNPVKKSTKAR